MASPEKRKATEDGRCFNLDWEKDFFFVDSENGPQCLVCRKKLAVYRKFNVRRHFETHHAASFGNLRSPAERDAKLRELKMAKELESTSEVCNYLLFWLKFLRLEVMKIRKQIIVGTGAKIPA